MKRADVIVVAALAATLFCSGCSDALTVSGARLTSATALMQGKRSPVSSFHPDDRIVMLVDLTWADPTDEAGWHLCQWKWYREGVLVSQSPVERINFRRTPVTLRSARPAAPLGLGHFKVETIVDDVVIATSQFDIAA